MRERREHKRVGFEIDVEYEASEYRPPDIVKARDISEEGICLATRDFIETGTSIDLCFRISGSDIRISVKGIVIWNEIQIGSNRFLNGIKFVDIEESQRDMIRQYVNNMTFDA